jgi:hypothetical protein
MLVRYISQQPIGGKDPSFWIGLLEPSQAE